MISSAVKNGKESPKYGVAGKMVSSKHKDIKLSAVCLFYVH